MKAYFISGLGADHRAFERLELPSGYQVIHIPWLSLAAGETLQTYSQKMSLNIDTKDPFVLVGLSFGGMVSVEISKIMKPEKLILISTAATNSAFPVLFKVAAWLNLDTILPADSFKLIRRMSYWFFGAKDKSTKRLLDYFFSNTTPQFLNWAVSQIVHWKNTYRFPNTVHVHGRGDKIFPASRSNADYLVSGGHLCVFTNSGEINSILQKELKA